MNNAPTPTPSGTEAAVCRDIAERQAKGIAKYGTTVADNPLELIAWLNHAYEEVLDQAIYLKRAIVQMDNDGFDLLRAVNASCSCGGRGYHEPDCCPACAVWHRLRGSWPATKKTPAVPS